MKTLVIYYSYEGNTHFVAETILKHIEADIERIEPVKEMKSKGFGKFIWGGSKVVMGKKPELKPISVDFSDYDKVFVGTPIWAGTYAPPVKTLLETGLLKGKEIIYFYTHEGGHSKAELRAAEVIGKDNKLLGVKDFLNPLKNVALTEADIQSWIQTLNL